MTEDTNTPQAEAPAAPAAAPKDEVAAKREQKKPAARKPATRSSGRKPAAKKPAARKPASKPAAAKKESTPRSKFPTYKTEAAAEKVMKANLDGYKQYQVERDKNRSERGMEKHRVAYKTYKNAYTQLLALRKASGKGRRNAAAS